MPSAAVPNMQELCDDCAPAKELFDKASEILGYDLLAVCSEGAASTANLVYSQHRMPLA